jgi:ABC-type sugar transport system permease subunit
MTATPASPVAAPAARIPGGVALSGSPRPGRRRWHDRFNLGFVLVLPALLFIFVLLIGPLIYTVFLSLHEADYLVIGKFLGVHNFVTVLSDPAVLRSIGLTFVVSFAGLAIAMVLGVGLALWVERRGGGFAYAIQIVGLVPWVTSMVVGGLLWKWLLAPDLGLVNFVLRSLGGAPIDIYATSGTAIVALTAVMAWRTIGYAMVMTLAGLKGISSDVIEASRVDGANAWQILFRIKVPLIKTPLMISSIVLFMSNFNNVVIPMVLTGGGPGEATTVASLKLYRMAFSYYQFGEASALSLVLFVINTVLTVVYIKAMRNAD